MKSLRWALIQYDWSPYRQGKFGQRHTQREDHMKTQGEEDHLQVKERGQKQIIPSQPSEETNFAHILVMKLWPLEL